MDDSAPALWVVAGCLFEVSLPDRAASGWTWDPSTPAVTLLATDRRQGRHHFRFRAESAGVDTPGVPLCFRHDDGQGRSVHHTLLVHVAPERLPGDH